MSAFQLQEGIKTQTDHTWIRNLKQRDTDTVQALWEMVFIYGTNMARHYNQEDDVGREAAIAAFHRIQNRGVNQFRFQCPFPAYCRLIVVNEVKRRLSKLPSLPAALADETHEDENAPDPVDLKATEQIVRERLAPCLDLLPLRKQDIVHRRYFEDKSPQSIANELGIQRNNVNKMAHDARQKLRECLEQHGFLTAGDVLSL